MTDAHEQAQTFFDDYAKALLARDEQAVARMYAVPGLIVFPGQLLPVTSEQQTAEFFASNWAQYERIQEANPDITVMGESPTGLWADVSWSYGDGVVRERFCYQLVPADHGHRIAVLTVLG